jgi:hypothetical protein
MIDMSRRWNHSIVTKDVPQRQEPVSVAPEQYKFDALSPSPASFSMCMLMLTYASSMFVSNGAHEGDERGERGGFLESEVEQGRVGNNVEPVVLAVVQPHLHADDY